MLEIQGFRQGGTGGAVNAALDGGQGLGRSGGKAFGEDTHVILEALQGEKLV